MKQRLLNFLLLTALVVFGSGGAWGALTPFSETYSANSTINGWSTGTGGRYTPVILNEDNNYFLSVNQGERNNNGATVTGTILEGKAAAGDNFTLTFDMRLSSSNNQTNTEFKILDASNSYILSLKESDKNATTWFLNGSNTKITLPNSKSGQSNLNEVTWCSYRISFKDGITYLTITNKETSESVFERAIITGGSTTGGLGKIQFISSRYNANFAIDNITLRSIQDGDVPSYPKYTIKYLDDNNNVLKTDRLSAAPAGDPAVITDNDKAEFFANNKKYIYVSDDSQGKTVAADGSTVVTVKFREAATYAYSVNAIVGGETTTIATGSTFEGEAVTVPYSQYILKGTTLYSIAANSSGDWYRTTFTPDGNNYVKTLNYNGTTIQDVVFYSEGENIAGANAGANTGRASNGQMGYTAGETTYKEVTTLAPGRYVIYGRGVNGNSAARKANFKIGDNTPFWSFDIPNGTNTLGNSESFVANNEVLAFASTGSSASGLDWLYIQRAGDAPVSGTLMASELESATEASINDNVSVEISGATLKSDGGTKYLEFADGGYIKLTVQAENYSIETVNVNASQGTYTVTNTTNGKQLDFSAGARVNSLTLGNATLNPAVTANSIADFKTADDASAVNLSGAEVLAVMDDGTIIVQDATAGIAIKGIAVETSANSVLTGVLAGKYVAPYLVNNEMTDFTAVSSKEKTPTVTEETINSIESTDNAYRLLRVKGVSIVKEKGIYYATKGTSKLVINECLFDGDMADYLNDGDILATLTGVTIPEGDGNSIAPRTAKDIVSGLVWKADNIEVGQQLPIDLTGDDIVSKLGELGIAVGDAITLNIISAENSTVDVLTYVDDNLMSQGVDGAGSVTLPITADILNVVKKHGIKLAGSGASVNYAFIEKAKFANNEDIEKLIWYSDEATDVTLGAIHFEDVRQGDVLTSDGTMTAGETAITSGEALTAAQAEALLNGTLTVSGATTVTFDQLAPRDDKSKAADGDSFAQGEKNNAVDGMLMTFGGNNPEGATYDFSEDAAELRTFKTATEGISQWPLDEDDMSYSPYRQNLPVKGTYYVFEPTKDGQLEVTVGLEAGRQLYVTEDGKEILTLQEESNYEGIVSVSVAATKTYYVFASGTNLKYYGFTFTPSSDNNIAKDIASFTQLAEGNTAGDTLLLKDAVVNYIKGDEVYVSDATGSIVIYQTKIRFEVGQVLNGYIIGQKGKLENHIPALLNTDATQYGNFSVTGEVTPEAQPAGIADVLKTEALASFVRLENVEVAQDEYGNTILTDGENSIRIANHFDVDYELSDQLESITGIVGIDSDGTYTFWPTSQDGVVPAAIPADFADGKYYIANLSAAIQADYAYLGAGNSWGTQASLVKHPEYVTLHKVGEGKYTLESQVSNGGNNIYFNGDFMDNNQPMTLTITRTKEPINDIEDEDDEPVYGYYIANEKSCFGWDGQSSVLGKGLSQDDDNAVWIIASEEEVKNSLLMAAEDDPQDATFLLLDPNFGRNNRWGKDLSTNAKVFANADLGAAWTFEASNKNNSGDNTNWCVESWHSTFNMSQTITDVPNGVYELTAQGFYRQDGEDNDNLPVFFINDQTAEFPLMTGTENSMTDASHSFSEGKYTIEPIRVVVTDGTITVGAKNEANVNLWCIWDNFELNYYGPAEDVETGSETELDIVNADDAKTKNNAIEGIAITIDGTYNAGTGSAMAGDMTSKGYKLRTNNGSNPKNSVVVNVNEGYTVTNFTINAISNYVQKDGVDAELPNVFVTKVEVDGEETSFNGGEFPAKGANDCGTLIIDGIKAKESIKIYFDNSNSAGQQLNMAYYVEWQKGEASKPLSSELVHTASSSCGSDANTYVSTVDAEKEHVNNEKFNAAWQGAAYAEFAFNVPDGQTVSNATFRFTAIGESRRARPAIVYVVNAGETLDYDAMTAGNAKVNLAGTKVADVTFPQNTSEVLEVDVTEALNTIIEAGQNFIIFKVTGNPGGGDMAGMASENAPELIITTDSEATGIKTIEAPTRTIEGVYTLSGQKVGDTTEGLKPGLYIVNGRKMIVK